MAGELKLNNVSVATESGGTVTIAPNNVTFAANHAGIKTALNAGGNAPVYACRAFVNFDGVNVPSIRASGNVSSITDTNNGRYTINMTTAMEDANYTVVFGSPRFNPGNPVWVFQEDSNITRGTSSFGMFTSQSNNQYDSYCIQMAVFR